MPAEIGQLEKMDWNLLWSLWLILDWNSRQTGQIAQEEPSAPVYNEVVTNVASWDTRQARCLELLTKVDLNFRATLEALVENEIVMYVAGKGARQWRSQAPLWPRRVIKSESKSRYVDHPTGHEIESEAVFSAVSSVPCFKVWFFVSP